MQELHYSFVGCLLKLALNSACKSSTVQLAFGIKHFPIGPHFERALPSKWRTSSRGWVRLEGRLRVEADIIEAAALAWQAKSFLFWGSTGACGSWLASEPASVLANKLDELVMLQYKVHLRSPLFAFSGAHEPASAPKWLPESTCN